jgi:hypothetical protein
VIRGDELAIRLGRGAPIGDTLLVTGLSQFDGRFFAIVSRHLRLNAETYDFISVDLQSLGPGQSVSLIWRPAADPENLVVKPLPARAGETVVLRLADFPEWHGTVAEIGLRVSGNSSSSEVRIAGLRLEPYSWRRLLTARWHAWSAPGRWDPGSINHLSGINGSAITSPAPALAAWSLLALLLSWWLCAKAKTAAGLSAAIVVALPWLAFDLLWQLRLGDQLDDTRRLFAGKSVHEKHLADIDAEIYLYARLLRDEALPEEPTRIHLLRKRKPRTKHDFDRLKLQYYLLPHNIHNFGKRPYLHHSQSSDYLLLLYPVDDFEYDPQEQTLSLGNGEFLAAQLVHDHALGRLFRLGQGDGQ